MATETDLNEQEQEQLQASQMDVVHRLYVGTADQDYIAARWCFTNGFYTNFFWLGVHALEKYQKAVLLLNNFTSKKFSHDIVDLYKAIMPISGDLLPRILTAPEGLQTGRDLIPEKFLDYLYARGNPHNRYLIYGYSAHEQDIFMLDQMVFAVRRLTIPLDGRAFLRHVKCAMTYRERLTREPDYFPDLSMPLDLAIQGKENSPVPVRMAAFAINLTPFTPAGFDDVPASVPRIAFQNSPIALRILDPLKRGVPPAVPIAVARWCLDNIELPANIKKEIEEAVAAASTAP